MKVYEIKVKSYLLKDIHINNVQNEICKIIDKALSKNTKWLSFHKSNIFKNYCFDSFYPIEKDKLYKRGNIYTYTIRSIDKDLVNYFNEILANEYSESIKCITTEIRIVPKKFIEKIYSLTPMIIKDIAGYWRENISIDDFERKLKENAIKKYNQVNKTKIDEDFELYSSIEFKNKKPYAVSYKNIKLLGDKISLNISDDEIAQDIAYMLLGTGVGENNARGCGFVGYRWL